MLKIGIIGFGVMGRTHLQAWQQCPDAEVVALCDITFADGKIPEEVESNLGTVEIGSLEDIALYTDSARMLAECSLDAISITLPTFLHRDFTVQALEAGVHVLCEKPMALNGEDCDVMIAAAEKAGKILQIGHCIRFWPEYVKAKEIIDSGEYGKLLFGNFYRLSAMPGWSGDSWFKDESRSGGVVLDLHIHDTDFILYLLGKPDSVSCAGARANGVINHIQANFNYADGPAIFAEGSWAMSSSFGFRMGFVIGMENATLEFNPACTEGLTVCPHGGEKFTAETIEGSGYLNEITHFAGRINGEDLPEVITPQQSKESVVLALAEKESAEKGESVRVN